MTDAEFLLVRHSHRSGNSYVDPIELPAGTISDETECPDEVQSEAPRRELREKTGHDAAQKAKSQSRYILSERTWRNGFTNHAPASMILETGPFRRYFE